MARTINSNKDFKDFDLNFEKKTYKLPITQNVKNWVENS